MPGASQFIILSMSEENIKLEGSKYHQCNSPINILSGRCKVANDLLTLTFRDESEQQLTSDTRGRELGRESLSFCCKDYYTFEVECIWISIRIEQE